MIRKLRGVLLFNKFNLFNTFNLFSRQPAPRQTTLFNGQLLDQKREDVFLALHQIGLIR